MFGDLPMRRLDKTETGGVILQIIAPPPAEGAGGGGFLTVLIPRSCRAGSSFPGRKIRDWQASFAIF